MPVTAHINIGSNAGPSRQILQAAVEAVEALSEGPALHSRVVESEPWGFESPNRFVNVGVEIETSLPPLELLDRLQQTEREVAAQFVDDNRHRNADGTYRDRALDIDIIFYGDTVMDTPRLTLPHPRRLEREFVMTPLREIAAMRAAAGDNDKS